MNRLLLLLVVGAILAGLKAATIVLVIALLLTLALCLVLRPRETLVFVGVLGLLGLADARPAIAIVTMGAVAVVLVITGARRKEQAPLLLTDDRERRLPPD